MSELIPITTPMREFEGHESWVMAVAVFPDKRRMVTASGESLRLWDLQTGVMVRKMEHHNWVLSLAVSRDGKLIASGDHDGEVIVWDGETGESLTQPIKAHSTYIFSLNFSPDGTALASGSRDKTTKLWNTRTWEQQGDPVECDSDVRDIRHSPDGKLLAIATLDDIQVYNLGTRERVPFFNNDVSLAWTPDGTRLLTGGSNSDPTIHEWDTSTWQQIGDPWTGHSKSIFAIVVNPAGTLVASASNDHHVRLWQLSDRRTIATFKHPSGTGCVTFSVDGKHILSGSGNYIISEWAVPHPKILAITTARFACISGELSIAEELLTQYINTNSNSHISYSHRSFVMARKHDWDRALQDAIKSINIKPSLTGYMSKGIAFCGKGYITDARAVFDVASMYTDQNSQTTHFLLLIKAIALFGADQHDEASLLLKELTTACPNADTRSVIVQAYLHVQLGIKALHGARYNEAAEHFTAAINCSTLSSKLDMHHIYEDLSWWWLQSSLVFHSAFTEKCSARCLTKGDAALAARNYESAIELYSAVIDLGCTSDVAFVNGSEANLGKMLWEDALLDAQKVIELDPSSHVGYQLTHAALRGAQHYDEAIDAFTIMLSKLDGASEMQIRDLHQQYIHPSQAEDAIQRAVWIELDNAPLRLLNTSTGLLLRTERIKEVVVMYFRCVLLSHRWEEMEALLQDIQDKVVYELNGLGGIAKLQSFCKVAR
ncbi:quinon protein alcohol dehydrogenase-like superfamily [Suillus spraguei]|nr:quinon protein alcohol dehydrogenase-like superfamily [Suillus spraguei]